MGAAALIFILEEFQKQVFLKPLIIHSPFYYIPASNLYQHTSSPTRNMLYLSTILTILAATSVTSLPLNINLGAFSPASIPPSPSRPVPYEIALRWSLVLVKVGHYCWPWGLTLCKKAWSSPKEVFCSVSHIIVLWFLRERDGPEC